ncbi:uncharacterized protein CC84DRAFT_1171915 [Paraphaeosphaeria sporulosa]|uniref:Cyanovirin-N domain-containing protein n=1 Tax=Paraphaeosphaeria sporulosa TaxID=1460663 RepID=A0A177CR05_9PLEO|nr:uncharacterized protein CC84DRAFT_1171915 [Paraphaeosphaeria sporulosa]OAG09320.1 hypothetical protein CC84DRAFT_1171915 [Paraphaeosphaeria sporulosa]
MDLGGWCTSLYALWPPAMRLPMGSFLAGCTSYSINLESGQSAGIRPHHMLNAETIEQVDFLLQGIKRISPRMESYLRRVWLDNHGKHLLSCYTNQFLHYGLTATSKVEGAHARIKQWLSTSNLDLLRLYDRLNTYYSDWADNRQLADDIVASKITYRASDPIFAAVHGRITDHTIALTYKQLTIARDYLKQSADPAYVMPHCRGTWQAIMGLPCSHVLLEKERKSISLQAADFDVHWWTVRTQDPYLPLAERILEPIVRRTKRKTRSTKREPTLNERLDDNHPSEPPSQVPASWHLPPETLVLPAKRQRRHQQQPYDQLVDLGPRSTQPTQSTQLSGVQQLITQPQLPIYVPPPGPPPVLRQQFTIQRHLIHSLRRQQFTIQQYLIYSLCCQSIIKTRPKVGSTMGSRTYKITASQPLSIPHFRRILCGNKGRLDGALACSIYLLRPLVPPTLFFWFVLSTTSFVNKMKLAIFILTSVAALTAASPVPELDGTVDITNAAPYSKIGKRSYTASCWNCGTFENPSGNIFMKCTCRNSGGGENETNIFLTFIIGNSNGQLVWNSAGFQRTCRNVVFNNPILSGECANAGGAWGKTQLNLALEVDDRG